MPRKLTDEQREMFEGFISEFPFCWACGIDPTIYRDVERERREVDYPRHLERHHLAKVCRVHERWNLFNACKLCHDLAEMHTVRKDLEPLPYLRLEHCLWLKRLFDPEHYNPDAMQRYLIRRVPEPTIPPSWFMLQLIRRKRTSMSLTEYAEEVQAAEKD